MSVYHTAPAQAGLTAGFRVAAKSLFPNKVGVCWSHAPASGSNGRGGRLFNGFSPGAKSSAKY